MKKIFFTIGLFALSLFLGSQAFAHTPLCNCWDNGDGTITCEGGFSDGSSAAGVKMSVMDLAEKVLKSGKMNEDSEFEFDKPKEPYKVLFDAGEGHRIEIRGDDIVE